MKLTTCLQAVCSALITGGAANLGLAATLPNTGMADSAALIAAYDKFVAGLPDAGRVQTIPLASLRGITSESFNAGGRVTIDATAGTVSSTVRLLPQTGSFDLWLADNRAASGHTTLADPSDLLLKVGTYTLAAAEVNDAFEVLSEGALVGNREPAIVTARAHVTAARAVLTSAELLPFLESIEKALEAATRSLRMARLALATPETLPPSFQN